MSKGAEKRARIAIVSNKMNQLTDRVYVWDTQPSKSSLNIKYLELSSGGMSKY